MSYPTRKNKVYFVKYPLCLSCLFSPTQTRFIAHMIEAEFLKSCGYNTDYSRKEWMRKMGLTEYSFDNAVKTLMEMGILSKRNNVLGNRVYYSFDMDVYDQLIAILSATENIEKITHFCDTKFKQEKRTVESITAEEISELEKVERFSLKRRKSFW